MRRALMALVLGTCASGAFAGPGGSLLQRAPARMLGTSNPLAGSSKASRAGAKLFNRECSACHGRSAQGIGKAPPLRSAEVSIASPGALSWVLRNGSPYRGMPSFAHLPEPERWQIITYLQTLQSKPVKGNDATGLPKKFRQ